MANIRKYNIDNLILEKLYSRKWVPELATGKIYSTDLHNYLKPRMNKGYLACGSGGIFYPVSRVIWICAHGVPELNYLEIDHINEDKTDNRLINLRLLTRTGNNLHSNARVDYNKAIEIRKRYKEGKISQAKLANEFNISKTSVGDIVNNRTHKSLKDMPDIDENLKYNIFKEICYNGNTINHVMKKYNVSNNEIEFAIKEQSLKVEISRRKK